MRRGSSGVGSYVSTDSAFSKESRVSFDDDLKFTTSLNLTSSLVTFRLSKMATIPGKIFQPNLMFGSKPELLSPVNSIPFYAYLIRT
jgi:hypothetical protein